MRDHLKGHNKVNRIMKSKTRYEYIRLLCSYAIHSMRAGYRVIPKTEYKLPSYNASM